MLTKTLVLLIDRLAGGFCPAPGLTVGKALEKALVSSPDRTGKLGLLAGDKGVIVFCGEDIDAGRWSDGEEDIEDWDLSPRRKPLPRNGMRFLIS